MEVLPDPSKLQGWTCRSPFQWFQCSTDGHLYREAILYFQSQGFQYFDPDNLDPNIVNIMGKRKQVSLIQGSANHRRTEGDYMSVLIDTVSLEDWRGVVTGALQAAKSGDPQARNWLAQYLVGRPEGKAPTPLTVVVQQLNGVDPLVNRLASPLIQREKYPSLHIDDAYEARIRAQVAAELQQKVGSVETIENPTSIRVDGDSAHQKSGG